MNGLLASVCSAVEARIVLDSGFDVIDCKNPHDGALGALPPAAIRRIVKTVGGARPTSATTGNDSGMPRDLVDAIRIIADCGVDYVKFGLFEASTAPSVISMLEAVCGDHELIAVCFVDRYDPTPFIEPLAGCGVKGIMLDTAEKSGDALTSLWSTQRLAGFVTAVQQREMLCGLAGKLALRDIPQLLPLQADYLGFRSALCNGNRRGGVDNGAAMRVRNAVPVRPCAPVTCIQGATAH